MRKSGTKNISIVGGWTSAVYTVKNRLQKAENLHITIFEAAPWPLADWARAADAQFLKRFRIVRDQTSDRNFYLRVLIGAHYIEQLQRLAPGANANPSSGARFTLDQLFAATPLL